MASLAFFFIVLFPHMLTLIGSHAYEHWWPEIRKSATSANLPQSQFVLSSAFIAMLFSGMIYPAFFSSDGGDAFLSMAYTALGALALGIVLNEWRIRREKKSAPQHWSRRMKTGR